MTPADREHLNLLRIFYWVIAGLHALGGCVPIIHLSIGLLIVNEKLPAAKGDGPPPAAFGWFFIVMAVTLMAVIWTIAVLAALVARRLGEHRGYTFVLVVAGLLCLSMPLGTLLGVFTIVVLLRPTVKAGFGVPAT